MARIQSNQDTLTGPKGGQIRGSSLYCPLPVDSCFPSYIEFNKRYHLVPKLVVQ